MGIRLRDTHGKFRSCMLLVLDSTAGTIQCLKDLSVVSMT